MNPIQYKARLRDSSASFHQDRGSSWEDEIDVLENKDVDDDDFYTLEAMENMDNDYVEYKKTMESLSFEICNIRTSLITANVEIARLTNLNE